MALYLLIEESDLGMEVSQGQSVKNQKGFSLIELLIVVAIILIVAAIAIPNLFRAKMAANESSATAALRVINTAQVSYSTLFPQVGYSATLGALGGPAAACAPPTLSTVGQACIIDELLSGFGPVPFVKSGYTFNMVPGAVVGPPLITYNVTATPVSLGSSGQNMFCSDQSGVVRHDPAGVACTNASLAVQSDGR